MKIFIWAAILLVAIKGSQKITSSQIRDDSFMNLLYVLDTIGIQNSRVVMCQWIHETGGMKSRIYRENHNPFGMKESSRHWDIGTQYGHANYMHYPHIGECTIECYMDAIYDYRDWQRARGWTGGTDEEYMSFLVKKNYAEDKTYVTRLKFYYSLIFN